MVGGKVRLEMDTSKSQEHHRIQINKLKNIKKTNFCCSRCIKADYRGCTALHNSGVDRDRTPILFEDMYVDFLRGP